MSGRSSTERLIGELQRRINFLEAQAAGLDSAQVMTRSFQGEIRFWSRGMERLYGFPAAEAVTKEMAVPPLVMLTVCGIGLAAPYAFVKLSEPASTKMLVPTVTSTGIVMRPPAPSSKTRSPVKVPAINPRFGRALATTPTVIVEGAVPVEADTVSQFPPSEVLVESVQFNAPVPAFRSWTVCEAGLPLDV